MTSNMIYIVALGVGFKCPRKITQCPPLIFIPSAGSIATYSYIQGDWSYVGKMQKLIFKLVESPVLYTVVF